LTEDNNWFAAHRFAPFLGLLTRSYYERRISSAFFKAA
jgi:hypothetical protein